MPQGKVFEFGIDEMESILPAANFAPISGNLKLALSTLSNLLGHHSFDPYGMKHDLERLFLRTRASSDPLLILCNIRRWALQGLQDEDLLFKLGGKGWLVALEPTTHTEPKTSSLSRSITAKQARCVLANAFIGNCIDVMAGSISEKCCCSDPTMLGFLKWNVC